MKNENKCHWFGVCYTVWRRGADDTQKGLNAEPPLESLGAANQVLSYMQGNIFDVTALMAHQDNMRPALSNKVHPVPSCADIALFIIHDEQT